MTTTVKIRLIQKPYRIGHNQKFSGLPPNWKKKLASHQSLDDTGSTESSLKDWVEMSTPKQTNSSNIGLELPGGVKPRMRQA